MEFLFTFQQAYIDRLLDVGVKPKAYQHQDDYVLKNEDAKRKPVIQQVKHALLAIVHLLMK